VQFGNERRWFQFSLWTLFVVVTVAALLAGESRREREAARRQASRSVMKQTSIACRNYHEILRAFPATPKPQAK
jgi:uncharacterized membrane protein